MSYGRVSEAFWHDDKIRALTEGARYFMLYLMSCPHGNRVGLFVLDLLYAAADVKWTQEKVGEALTELRDSGRILWDEKSRVVFVRYYLRHNPLANGNVVKGAVKDLESLPDTRLLGDLLDTVVEEMKGPESGKRQHYEGLIDAIRVRLRLPLTDPPENGVDTDDRNRSANRLANGLANGLANPGLGRGRIGSGTKQAYSPPPPNLTQPDLTQPDPTLTRDGEDRLQDRSLEEEISRALPRARTNIVAIHGSPDDVEIHGHRIGVGLEIEAFRRLCREGRDPPDIIAEAIRHLPEVTSLAPPISLARWGAEDGPEVYERCVALAYKAMPANIGAPVKDVPTALPSAELAKRKAALKGQLERLRKGASA